MLEKTSHTSPINMYSQFSSIHSLFG